MAQGPPVLVLPCINYWLVFLLNFVYTEQAGTFILTFVEPETTVEFASYDIEVQSFDPQSSKNYEAFSAVRGVTLPYNLRLPSGSSYYTTLYGVTQNGGRYQLYSLPATDPNGKYTATRTRDDRRISRHVSWQQAVRENKLGIDQSSCRYDCILYIIICHISCNILIQILK